MFCELGGPKAALTSQTLLSEGNQYQQTINDQYDSGLREKIIQNIGDDTYEFNMDFSSLQEATDDADIKPDRKKEKKKARQLANLHLIFHDPQFVVKLQSAMFPICFGYLVFPVIFHNLS